MTDSPLMSRLVPNPGEIYDPNLFRVDWDRLFEVLLVIIVLAFFVERALSLLFESRPFLLKAKEREERGQGSMKAPIAFSVAAIVCVFWQFDAFSIVLLKEHTTILGAILTGATVAGGSKASIKLFIDLMGVRSIAYQEIKQGQTPPATASKESPPETKLGAFRDSNDRMSNSSARGASPESERETK